MNSGRNFSFEELFCVVRDLTFPIICFPVFVLSYVFVKSDELEVVFVTLQTGEMEKSPFHTSQSSAQLGDVFLTPLTSFQIPRQPR